MAEAEIPKVGGDVDAYCSRCDMDLAHTVVAMVSGRPVQTKCNTCGTFHRYRPPTSAPAPPRAGASARSPRGATPATSRAARPTSWERLWEQQVAQTGEAAIQKYRMTEDFSPGDLLQHSKYGLGAVQKKTGDGKIEVLFRTGLVTLVINRPGPAPSR